MRNMKISLVIPAYNEAAIIENTVRRALEYLSGAFRDFELIIADDGSTDDTMKKVLTFDDEHLSFVAHFPNKGKGAAVREGVLSATGEIVAYTDADLAYGLEALGLLADKLVADNADLAIGSRKLHPEGYADYPPIRLFASRCFSLVTGVLAGFHYDTQCGLKAFRRECAGEIFSRCELDGFAFDFEAVMVAVGLGYKITQLPVTIVNHRESKVNVIKDSLKMFADVIRIRRGVKARFKKERTNGV